MALITTGLIIGGAIATITGGGMATRGIAQMKNANEIMEFAKEKQEKAISEFENTNGQVVDVMDSIGKKELKILKSFEYYSNIIERIQGKPAFDSFHKDDICIPLYEQENLKRVSVGAGLLLSGIGSAAAGTAGAFAAAGAVTSAVAALGTASTGTAIASLSGAALTNATLAVLGGGTVAAGGGGIALGSTVLGVASAGIGILIGGIIFGITGSKLSDKAEEAYEQAIRTEEEVDNICKYLRDLENYSRMFMNSLTVVSNKYKEYAKILNEIIIIGGKNKWSDFSNREKQITQNSVLLVGLLYDMCQLQLVIKDTDGDGQNEINVKGVNAIEEEVKIVLNGIE